MGTETVEANLLIVDSARESSSTILFSSKKPIVKESGENLRETSEVDNTETKSSRKQQDKYKCESKTNNSVIENQSTPQSQDIPTKRKRASLNYSELQASSEESDVESASNVVKVKHSASVKNNSSLAESSKESSTNLSKEPGDNLKATAVKTETKISPNQGKNTKS